MIGLPTLRAFDHQESARIWLAAAPVDMRSGFDRLAEVARAVTGQDPFHAHLFIFRSRRGDRLKVLQWDRDGYVLSPLSGLWSTFTPPHHAASAASRGLFLLRRVQFLDSVLDIASPAVDFFVDPLRGFHMLVTTKRGLSRGLRYQS